MTRSKTFTTALLIAASGFISTGCVSQGSHDDLQTITRQQQETIFRLEQQIEELKRSIEAKNAQLAAMSDQSTANAALRARLAEEQARLAELRNEIARLSAELDKSKGDGEIVIIEGIPKEVSNALRDLAAANADLMEYDEQRGMIRLRSDLTFALGSATVSDAAKSALGKLARVLNDNAAAKFDIQVIGHTDAVPVKSATGRKLHIDNRGLSSNRGDAVARVLISKGVRASRVVSGGRGATQPIAANNARGQSRANRRVEIFLVKASDSPAPQPPAGGDEAPRGGGGGGEVGEGTPTEREIIPK